MAGKLYFTEFENLKRDVQTLLPINLKNIQFRVSEEDQQKEIKLLKETIKHERFFFVVNLLKFEVEEVNGFEKYLGYSDKELTFKKYWNHIIHPGKEALKLLARIMYEELCGGKYELKFLVQRFTSMVPLKHSDGHYVLTKKTSSVFQFDTNNRLLSYIDEFTFIGDYQDQPLSPRIIEDIQPIGRKELLDSTIKKFIQMKVFSAQELQVVRYVAYNPSITQKEIAQKLNIKISSVNTYYKRFLVKARDFFRIDFININHCASYLKQEYII